MPHALDFARLVPADKRTARSVQAILDQIQDQTYEHAHHKKYVEANVDALVTARSPTFTFGSDELTDGITTEADLSDDEEVLPACIACYVLGLEKFKLPFQPTEGYWFGMGDIDRYPDNAGVDIRLPAANFDDYSSTRAQCNVPLYARHGRFAFNPLHGTFWLHARHKGIRVDDRPIPPKGKILLRSRMRISIGPHRFIYQVKVEDENLYQTALWRFIKDEHGQEHRSEATSATPSANDIRINDWILHRVIGASELSVIHAASHGRSGQVVAVKRLRFGSSQKRAEKEDRLYDDIGKAIQLSRYRAFVMQKHSILSAHQPHVTTSEAFLLLTPLARMGGFSQLGHVGRYHGTSKAVKEILFVQIAMGLSALHDSGWIHRDLKPANLGIVELGQTPKAVIIDLGQACRQRKEGLQPKPKTVGTIGYLAPELENSHFAPTYDAKIDVWSLGAVAYYLFVLGRIPWNLTRNMFLQPPPHGDTTLVVFREIRKTLLSGPPSSIESLIGNMLAEYPQERPSIREVLGHPALRNVCAQAESLLEYGKSAGQKRGSEALTDHASKASKE